MRTQIFEAMPSMGRHRKSDIRDSTHVNRRRRLSFQSACGNGDDAGSYDEYKDGNGDDTNGASKQLQLIAPNDIRLEHPLKDTTQNLPDPTIDESPEQFLQ
jgi:hypothetical protein